MSGPALRQTLSSCRKQATCSAQPLQLSFSGALAAILREGNPLAYQSSAGPFGPGSPPSSRSANICFKAACDSDDQQGMSCSHQHSTCLLKNRLSEGAPAALRGTQSGQGMQAIAQPAQGAPHHPVHCSQGNSNSIHSLQPHLPPMPRQPAEPSCKAFHAHPSSSSSSCNWPIRGSWQLQGPSEQKASAPSLPHWPHAEAHAQPREQARLFQAIAPAAMTSSGHAQQSVRGAATAGLSAKVLANHGQIDKAVALLRSTVAGNCAVAAKDCQAVIAALCQAGQAQDAVNLLRELPAACRTLKSAHDILRRCVDAQRMGLAARLLDDLEGLGLQWNPWTWYLATCLQEQAPQKTASRSSLNATEGLRGCWRDICNVILLARSPASSRVIAAAYQELLMRLSGADSAAQPTSDAASAANDFHEASAEAQDSVRANQHLHGGQSRRFHQHASQHASASGSAPTDQHHQPHLPHQLHHQLPWPAPSPAGSPNAPASDVNDPSEGCETTQWQEQRHSSLEGGEAWSMQQPSKPSSTGQAGGGMIDPKLVGILRRAGQEAFEKLVQRGAARAAWTIIEAMRQVDLPVGPRYGLQLMGLLAAKERDARVLEAVLQDLLSSGATVHPTTLEPLLKAYAQEGNYLLALDVLENVNGLWEGRTGYLYNVLIKALLDSGHSQCADICYQTMREHGFEPSIITFTLLFKSVGLRSVHWHQGVSHGSEPSSQGSFNAALSSLESWVADLQAAQLPLDIQCLTALLNAFGMTRQTERMLELLEAARRADDDLPRPDVKAWGAAISNCVHQGPEGLDAALDLLSKMEADGVKADSRIYVGLMHGCSNHGRLEQARELFLAASQLPLKADASPLHQHNALIKAECVAGNFEKALHIVANMPMLGLNPTDTTWNHITRRAADAGRTDIIRQVTKLQRQPLASRWDRFVANLLSDYPTSAQSAAFLPKGNFDDDSDDDDSVGGVPVF